MKYLKYLLWVALGIIGVILVWNFVYLLVNMLPGVVLRGTGILIQLAMIVIIGSYIGGIIFMIGVVKTGPTITKTAKYSAVCGLLSLVFLLFGVGLFFGLFGIIFGLIGLKSHNKESRQTSLAGLISSLGTIVVLVVIIVIGFMGIR